MRVAIKETIKKRTPFLFSVISGIKSWVLSFLVTEQKKKLLKKIEQFFSNDHEMAEIISFLRANTAEMIPYFFTKEYSNIPIQLTKVDRLWRASFNGTTIYYPAEMTGDYVLRSFRVGLMEQDIRSPHKYLPIGSVDIGGDVAVLCGASDCIYALQIISKFKKIYLFEANPIWLEPIRTTMRDYLHKIEIVPFFVSDKTGPNMITLDDFFRDRNEKIDYLQADIEGDEIKMLKGASSILSQSKDIKIAICCYHSAKQKDELAFFLSDMNYEIQCSSGYVLMWMEYPLRAPYLRKAVLYASKKA